MKRNCAAAAIIIGLAGIAADASAVNLSSNGLGQVLIYPYYTVNAGQQTLLSVVNTTSVGKAVKVRFLEAYNGRDVLDFNLYLSSYDVWTADIFALRDAGIDSDAAGIFTDDHSCTDPVALTNSGTIATVGGSRGYQRFLEYGYTGFYADNGPEDVARTREGHIEMILMANVVPATRLSADITHVEGMPPDCAAVRDDVVDGLRAPTIDPPSSATGLALADGGLFGSATIVNGAEGTFYGYNADAIDGFSYVSLYTAAGEPLPNLASANDRDDPLAATSHVFSHGEVLTSTFPGADPGSRTIDAVSSLFAADAIYNEYVTASNDAIGTDWVVTFPTKRFYVDPLFVTTALPPFEELFGEFGTGESCVTISATILAREETATHIGPPCGFLCPPPPSICLDTNVIRFSDVGVVGSQLPGQRFPSLEAGMVELNLTQGYAAHDLLPASNGNIFHGLPVTGFAATKFVNGFVALPGGGYALANYTAAYHQRATTACANASGVCL